MGSDNPINFKRQIQDSNLNELQNAVLHKEFDGTVDVDFTDENLYDRRPRQVVPLGDGFVELEDSLGEKVIYPAVTGIPIQFQPARLVAAGTDVSVVMCL